MKEANKKILRVKFMQQKGNDKNMKDKKLAELIVKLLKLKENKKGTQAFLF